MADKLIKKPFGNESECAVFRGLTIENRLDRICLSGSIEVTFDKEGLIGAEKLADLFNAMITKMKSVNLEEKVVLKDVVMEDNPFL